MIIFILNTTTPHLCMSTTYTTVGLVILQHVGLIFIHNTVLVIIHYIGLGII